MDEEIERRNTRVCVALDFVRQIFLGSSVMNTYYTDAHGLTQTQIFWLQTTLNVVFVLSDMPFGYLADKFGVRRVIFTGNLLQLAQGSGFMLCTTFWQFQLALIGTGLYVSAQSNSSSSLITASVAYIKDGEERAARYEAYESAASRARSWGICVGTLGGGMAVYLGGISVPFMVQPFIWLVCLCLGFGLRKPTHQIQIHTTRRSLRDIVKLMLRDRPAVRYAILLYASVSCCTFVAFWIFQPRLKVAGVEPKYFGVIYFCQYAIVASLTLLNRKVRGEKKQHDERIWLWSIIAITSLALCAGVTTSLLPVLVYMLVSVYAINLLGVIIRSYLHEVLPHDPSSRTTELSVMTSIISLLYAVIGPLVGALIDHVSVGAAYIAIAVFGLSCALPAYRTFMKYVR